MLSGKRGAPWCDRCGTVARFSGDMSHIGICEECSEWALVDNLRGMVDKESVPYKRWLVAHQMSRPGRPGKYTPSQVERDIIYALNAKNRDTTATCVPNRDMPKLEWLTVDAGGREGGHDGRCQEVAPGCDHEVGQ